MHPISNVMQTLVSQQSLWIQIVLSIILLIIISYSVAGEGGLYFHLKHKILSFQTGINLRFASLYPTSFWFMSSPKIGKKSVIWKTDYQNIADIKPNFDFVAEINHSTFQWHQTKGKLRVYIRDGSIEVTSPFYAPTFLKHKDSSIKKDDFKYFSVNGAWRSKGDLVVKGVVSQG